MQVLVVIQQNMHLSFLSLGLHVPLCLISILKSAKIEMSGCKRCTELSLFKLGAIFTP